MSVPPLRPDPPVVGKVTHHSIELYWETGEENGNEVIEKGDGRIRFILQENDKYGGWGNIYTGYAKNHLVDSLDPLTQYKYRIRSVNDAGVSDWSALVTVSTTKEPLTGDYLHRAITVENADRVKDVLETGDVYIDTPDKFGLSPLMSAAQKGYTNIAKILIKYGADVNLQNDSGKNALMLSCFSGKMDVVKILRRYKAKWDCMDKGGSTPMHWAVDGGNANLIKWMIADNCPVDIRDAHSGWTPLMRACTVSGNVEVARTLINHGAQVDTKDKDGKTPLMIAVLNGHLGLVELLVEKGVDPYIKNEHGKTAIEMAHSFERRRIIRFFDDLFAAEKEKNNG